MEWSDVTSAIGSAAPIVGSLLGGPAGGAVGSLVASALGVDNSPDAVNQALQQNPEAFTKLRQLEQEHAREMRRMSLEAETSRLAEINKTMRAELASDSAFKSSWRPLFGYGAAVTWVGQVGAIIYAVVVYPGEASRIIEALGALTGMWGIALAVLGVNINKRSHDKQVKAGQKPGGLLQAITGNK